MICALTKRICHKRAVYCTIFLHLWPGGGSIMQNNKNNNNNNNNNNINNNKLE